MQRNIHGYPAGEKLLGLLRSVLEELDVPLFYTMSGLSKLLRCSSPSMDALCNAITSAGYRVSLTHCSIDGVKTDAPPDVRSHDCERIAIEYGILMGGVYFCF
jgi:tRNA (guanine26-N2/guanine27-N2)-dimethyltransferase